MSWRFSQALVAEFLEATSSDGGQYALSSKTNMPQVFWSPVKTIELSRLSRYGVTYALLTENLGKDLLTWFLADSRVRTYQLLATEPELTGNDQDFGEKWQESSVKYSLDSSLWKTHQCLFSEDLPWSSVTLPRWGMMRNGVVYQRKTLVRPISATGSGLWPTPNACTASSALNLQKSGDGREKPNKLGWAVAITMWPTPVASMSKGSSQNCLTRKNGKSRANDRLDHAIMSSDGGHLNPDWVEWLMGWPIGWTDLKPLGTDKFQEWFKQHGM